jgi:PAS domain S-box-containing protein
MTDIHWPPAFLLIAATIIGVFCWVIAPPRTTGRSGTKDRMRIDMPSRGLFLSTLEPTQSQRNGAMVATIAMLIACAALSPYARTPLPMITGPVTTADAMYCVVYFVTGHILLGQFRTIRTYSMLVLAFGFFFQSWILGLHLLAFPGSFFVLTEKTAWVATAWMYVSWHLSFPLFIIAYALQHGRRPRLRVEQKNIVAFATVAIILLGGAILTGLTLWSGHLPTIMIFDRPDGRYLIRFLVTGVSPTIVLADLLAFWLVWRNGDSVLDVWLMVAVCAAGLDIAMTGIIGDRRFDVSYYAGRGFGMLSALFLLVPLMTEVNRLYASLFYRQRDTEAKHRAIVDTAIDGIIVIDRFGSLQSMNPAALNMFGYTLDEVAGKSIRMLIPEKYHADFDRHLARNNDTFVLEMLERVRPVDGLRKDGSMIELDLSIAEWFAEGEKQFTGIVRDNTERRQIERQLVQSQKMEAIGQLTGGMAHDFNNLLGIVINNIDLAIESYATPEAIPQEITGALNAAMTGADLVQRMLAFARRQPLQPKVTHLTEVVDEMLPLLRRTIGATVEINVAFDEAVSPVLVDPAQFENAVLNLVLNSRAAMPDGGKILLEIQSQVIDAASADEYDVPAGHYTLIVVTDTGSGISKENLERVFEPFFTTKPVGLGSGLGLSMVFGYVRQSGGVIRIYSELGRGTTIRIYLPNIHTGTIPVEKAPPPDIATLRGNARILIVEDVEAARNLAKRIVSELGYTVQTAADALAALALLDAGERFDLLFTDIMMPEMDGEALAKIVRQRFPDIKILFASGFSLISSETIDTLKARYITKPYRKVELAQTLKQMLTEKEPRCGRHRADRSV